MIRLCYILIIFFFLVNLKALPFNRLFSSFQIFIVLQKLYGQDEKCFDQRARE